MKTKLLYLTIIILTAISCKQEDCCDYPEVFSKSFVRGYLIPDSIITWNTNDTMNIFEREHQNCSVGFEFTGKLTFENIDSFSNKYNDTTYNSFCSPYTTRAISCIIDSIDVTSNKKFNNNLPEGASLKSVAVVKFNSYGDFVKNNYQLNNKYSMFGGVSHRKEKLSDYLPNMGMLWVNCKFVIYFTQTPTEHKTHNLTFKFFLDDGRVLCATTEYTFE